MTDVKYEKKTKRRAKDGKDSLNGVASDLMIRPSALAMGRGMEKKED